MEKIIVIYLILIKLKVYLILKKIKIKIIDLIIIHLILLKISEIKKKNYINHYINNELKFMSKIKYYYI